MPRDAGPYLDPALNAVASRQRGLITAAQAHEHGIGPKEVEYWRSRGVLVTIRRGVYAQQAQLARLSRDERYLQSIHAAALTLAGDATISHVSAGVLRGLDLLAPDLRLVHVTRESPGAGRTEAGIQHHVGALPTDHVERIDGLSVTTLARTAVDIARESDLARGVVALDSALRAGAAPDEVRQVMSFCAQWPGARVASRAVSLADGRAESVGESRSRLLFVQYGLPMPDLQVELYDDDGLIGRVDFLWRRQRLVGEFDGRVKYGLADGDPDATAEILWLEKRREDRIRRRGYGMVRWTWGDLEQPRRFMSRLATELGV